MKSKTITMIGHTMNRGGASKVLTILANHFIEKGYNVNLIFVNIINSYPVSSEVNLINLKSKSGLIRIPSLVMKIRRIIKKYDSSIVISFLLPMNIISVIATIGLKAKLIISERNDPSLSSSKSRHRFANWIYQFADAIVFQSERVKKMFSMKIQEKSLIINNPIHIESKKEIDLSSTRLISVGKLYPQKNHELLIDAFHELLKTHPHYDLWIYGEGPLRDKLTKKIRNLDIVGRVHLPGVVKDVHEEMVKSRVFILSSDYEGQSNALLEAMALGLPCISTNCAGSNEIIDNMRNGILIPIGKKTELVQAIRLLLDDRSLSEFLGKNSSVSIERNEKILTQWENIVMM